MAGIDQPGVYTIGEDLYHGDPVTGGSLSSTGARTLITSSPAKFRYQADHGRPDTAAFDLGRAAHTQVLGIGAGVVAVNADNWRTKSAQAAARVARETGATPLLAKDAARVTAMADALRAHPTAGPLFARPGVAEQTFVWQDAESDVWCRSRVDWLPDVAADGRVLIVDYKSTADAHPAAVAKSMVSYGYHQQGAFYDDGVTALGLDHGQPARFVLVAQEKDPPYLVSIGEPTARAMEWGRVLNRKARDIYRQCVEAGVWPGYSDGVAPLDLPGWLVNTYENNEARGAYDCIGDLL